MDTSTLKQILIEEMEKYAGKGLNDYGYLTRNDVEQIYSVIVVAHVREKRFVSTVLVGRIIADAIVIEIDQHDKMLVDALLARDVPKEQIILACCGDAVPA
ncbi:MAG: element excision factor XisI family protein [Chloroflexota bacterium]